MCAGFIVGSPGVRRSAPWGDGPAPCKEPPHLSTPTPDQRERSARARHRSDVETVAREQVMMLYRYAPITLASAGLSALALLALIWPVTPRPVLLAWAAGGALVLCARIGCLVAWHLRRASADQQPQFWRRLWLGGIAASGLTWGAAVIWLFPETPLHQMFFAVVMLGLCAGAVALYAAVRGAYILFAVPALVPLIVQCVRQGDPAFDLVCALLVLFLVGTVLSSYATGYLVERLGELKRSNEELSWRASHDPLVALPNQREFRQRLAGAAAGAESHGAHFAVLYIDLDGFKAINDRFGHAAGDAILRQIGRVLRGRVRATDTAARLGGDEFGVLLSPCPREHAERIARSICEAIAELDTRVWGVPQGLSASIGVACSHEAESTPAGMMRAADAACYQAKHAGRNRVVVYEADAHQTPSGRFAILGGIESRDDPRPRETPDPQRPLSGARER